MTLKEFVIKNMQIFFLLVTLILTAEMLLGMLLAPNQKIMYKDLYAPILTAALCLLPSIVIYSKKELSVKQLLVRKVIQLVLIEGVVLVMAAFSDVMSHEPLVFILLGAIVLVIFVLTNLFLWFQQNLQSKKMNDQLRTLQSQAEK